MIETRNKMDCGILNGPILNHNYLLKPHESTGTDLANRWRSHASGQKYKYTFVAYIEHTNTTISMYSNEKEDHYETVIDVYFYSLIHIVPFLYVPLKKKN